MNNLKRILFVGVVSSAFAACGGNNSRPVGSPGDSHNTGTGTGNALVVEDMTDPSSLNSEGDPSLDNTTEEQALVTFVLKNSSSDSLFLNMDKGWAAVIYAYSGQPPNAKSILMFPTHCTASCDLPKEEICPYCPELTRAKDIKAAENHDEVAAGEERVVPWDTAVFSYSRKRVTGSHEGKRTRCKCYTTSEVPPETYTIKACGLRKTKSAKQPSKYQCVEGSITLPVTEPITVELDFGK